jgi:hypothetical protein
MSFLATHPVGFGAGGVDATVTHTDNDRQDTPLTTYTFTGKSLGTAATGRRIIVGVTALNSASRTISSLTVGGHAATQVAFVEASGGGGFVPVGLYVIQVDTGTTANIVVTFSAGATRCGIGVFAAYDLLSSTATDTDTSTANPQTDSINVDGGGVLVGYAHNWTSGVDTTNAWTNLTERFDQSVETTVPSSNHSGASDAFASSQAVTVTCTPSTFTAGAFCLASFR